MRTQNCHTLPLSLINIFTTDSCWIINHLLDVLVRVVYCCTFLQARQNTAQLVKIYRGYYTVARRYEFYVRVARTISHSFALLTREILFLPLASYLPFYYMETKYSTKAKGGNRDVIE